MSDLPFVLQERVEGKKMLNGSGRRTVVNVMKLKLRQLPQREGEEIGGKMRGIELCEPECGRRHRRRRRQFSRHRQLRNYSLLFLSPERSQREEELN